MGKWLTSHRYNLCVGGLFATATEIPEFLMTR